MSEKDQTPDVWTIHSEAETFPSRRESQEGSPLAGLLARFLAVVAISDYWR
jgi:hypothetical protein